MRPIGLEKRERDIDTPGGRANRERTSRRAAALHLRQPCAPGRMRRPLTSPVPTRTPGRRPEAASPKRALTASSPSSPTHPAERPGVARGPRAPEVGRSTARPQPQLLVSEHRFQVRGARRPRHSSPHSTHGVSGCPEPSRGGVGPNGSCGPSTEWSAGTEAASPSPRPPFPAPALWLGWTRQPVCALGRGTDLRAESSRVSGKTSPKRRLPKRRQRLHARSRAARRGSCERPRGGARPAGGRADRLDPETLRPAGGPLSRPSSAPPPPALLPLLRPPCPRGCAPTLRPGASRAPLRGRGSVGRESCRRETNGLKEEKSPRIGPT